MLKKRHMSHLVFVLVVQALLWIAAVAVVHAARPGPYAPQALGRSAVALAPSLTSSPSLYPALFQGPEPTDLEVSIVSSPWATLDHNNPTGNGEQVPQVFVVEAVVTNTGNSLAVETQVVLDYNEVPANNWVLLPGEDPERSIDELAPGASYHVYWFARYSAVIGASHQYTVTARAQNAVPVSTSDNAYGNPEPGKTIKTRSALSTGNSGVAHVSAEVVVGVAFTITVDYDLGTNPLDAHFSPVGNVDFAAGAYRLLASSVRFYNDAGTEQSLVNDSLYFESLPGFAQNAEAVYTFIAVTPADTTLCSYNSLGYQSNHKYDQFYCDSVHSTAIPINGRLFFSMTKEVSSAAVEQNGLLTYTIHYTNETAQPLSYVWIWDDVDRNVAGIAPGSLEPAGDANETTDSRAAWYLGAVASAGQAGSSGTLSLAVRVDGNGLDLEDGTLVDNLASFGVNPGSLPSKAALTATVSSLVQAPTVAVAKTDGQATAGVGELLTYSLRISNTGSITASGLVITDLLPAGVVYAAGAQPAESGRVGQQLSWTGLPPIPPGSTTLLTIPVTVAVGTANGTVLQNGITARYQNAAGWTFDPRTAGDSTLVQAPVLSIFKSAAPDPVLAGRSLVYTLHYANNGPAAASNVVITDTVPSSTTYQSCSGGTTCGESGGVVQWDLGTLGSGASGTVAFTVQVDGLVPSGSLIWNEEYGLTASETGVIVGQPVSTLVNREAGVFEGYAFVDGNGNGLYDGGDSPFPGVTISLPGALVPVTVTNASGHYRFAVEKAGPVAISADLPSGYFHTSASTVFADSLLGVTQTVNFGYAPDTAAFGVVYGTVYADADHDGSHDLGEKGLVGVEVASDLAATSPVDTDAFGCYTLRFGEPGLTNIIETNPPLYVSTTPDAVSRAVAIGSSNGSPVDFGDFGGILIRGDVFDDADVDGVRDAGEAGLASVLVTAGGQSQTTDGSGSYALYVALPAPAAVTVQETDPPGYVSTVALPGNGMTMVDANTLVIASPISGTVYAGGDFGDVLEANAVEVSGQVWNDNGAGGGGLANGLRDGTEPGLAGALVLLSSGTSQTTGADGSFVLYGPAGETLVLEETNPAGYESTNAVPGAGVVKLDNDRLEVAPLAAGGTAGGNLFGDVQAGSVAVLAGTVFDDANENGQMDGGEAGLAGVTVRLERAGSSPVEVQTGAGGGYQFAVLPGSNVRLVSLGPGGGYYPTTLEALVVRPEAAGFYPGHDFGYSDDADVSVIYGIVFDDLNSNGEQDLGELGLGGAEVHLNDSAVALTPGSGPLAGSFSFLVTQPSVYAVHEVNPPGYRSTTPDSLNVPVMAPLGGSHFVAFGDTLNPGVASIYGTVFDDADGDGQQGATEIGLAGVVISVTVGGGTGVLTTTTHAYGQYAYGFEVGEAGYHTVSEQDPALPGYRSTTPDDIVLNISLGQSYIVNFGDTANGGLSNILGIVFYDEDSNGRQDVAELGLAGVQVALSNGMLATTQAYGEYTFALDSTGYVEVRETDPPGFHSTTPNTVTVHVAALGQVYNVDFGDNGDAFSSSLYGTVFDDANVNGGREAGEMGLAGVEVTIAGPIGGLDPTYVTNEWGQYTFLIEATGTFTLSETDPAGYVSTAAIPGDAAVTALDANTLQAAISALGGDLGDNLFGDAQAEQVVTVGGQVWNDDGAGAGIAGDGLCTGDEAGLAGALVGLSSGLSTTTGADGVFSLYAPAGQAVIIAESNPAGYVSTAAIPGSQATLVDADHLQVAALPGGSAAGDNLFGDVLPADLSVHKSGSPDPVPAGTALVYTIHYANQSEQLSENVVVVDTLDPLVTFGGMISQPAGWSGPVLDPGPPASLTWSTAGLAAGAAGDLVFSVTVPAETAEGTTLQNTAEITGSAPEANTENDETMATTTVGPRPAGTIQGTVFEDLDGNGLQGALEPGLEGVLLTVDETLTATTNAAGFYSFILFDPGAYTVVETDPAHYLSTTPNTVTVSLAMGDVANVDFGDLWIGHCSCAPDAYEDDEPAGQGATLTAGSEQAHDFCDDAEDWALLDAEAGQVFTLTTSSWGQRADTVLGIYDQAGQHLLAGNDDQAGTADFSSQVIWTAPAAGTYSVLAANRSGLSGCLTDYYLSIEASTVTTRHVYLPIVIRTHALAASTVAPAAAPAAGRPGAAPLGVIDHACPDAYEVDDSWQQARPLVRGVAQVHSFDSDPAVFAADKDLAWIDLGRGESLTVTVAAVTNTLTLLELYDGEGNALGVTGGAALSWKAETPGRYYVGVSPQAATFGCSDQAGYRLVAETRPEWWVFLPLVMRP